jgi:hypothetical protein
MQVITTIMNDCILEDLGSTNGTLVNGVLAKRHVLRNNDLIELGKYKLKFVGVAPAACHSCAHPCRLREDDGLAPGHREAPDPAHRARQARAPVRPMPRRTWLLRFPAPLPASQAPFLLPPRARPGVRAGSGGAAGAPAYASAPVTSGGGAGGVVRILSGPALRTRSQALEAAHHAGQARHAGGRHHAAPARLFHRSRRRTADARQRSADRHVAAGAQGRRHFEIADVRMEFLQRDEPADAAPSSLWKVVLVLVAIVIAGYVIYRLRG